MVAQRVVGGVMARCGTNRAARINVARKRLSENGTSGRRKGDGQQLEAIGSGC
jgi:hypothetical protein